MENKKVRVSKYGTRVPFKKGTRAYLFSQKKGTCTYLLPQLGTRVPYMVRLDTCLAHDPIWDFRVPI